MNAIDKKSAWAAYYEYHKRLWFNPSVPWCVKCVVRIVELHRSDARGWSLSIRKIAGYLGLSTNTALRAVRKALDLGFVEASTGVPRKRRKLRLSVSLRAPDTHEITSKQLTHIFTQSVPVGATESVSPRESVNIKTNIKRIDNVPEKEKKPFKGKEFEKLREVVNRYRTSSR